MHIDTNLYGKIREVIPTCCVDLVITNQRNEFLLLKRTESPAKGQWWLPGGRVHKNETLREAAFRKGREELGIEIILKDFISVEETIFEEDNVHTINNVFHAEYSGQILKLDRTTSKYLWKTEIDESLHFAVKDPIKTVMERL